jgi:hypothetical protein
MSEAAHFDTPPKSAVLYPIRLDELFDLTLPDLYTVSVTYKAPLLDSGGNASNVLVPVQSNEIHFNAEQDYSDQGKIIPLTDETKAPDSQPTKQPTAAP